MNKFSVLIFSVVAFITISSFREWSRPDDKVDYPEGFRTWTHVKTTVSLPPNPAFKHNGGFHHIYANEKALEGYATGKFPDGSVLVFDVIEGIDDKGININEGKRRMVDVMMKDTGRFAATGGWGYEEFDADSKTTRKITDAVKQCFTCHSSKKDNDYVFSTLRK